MADFKAAPRQKTIFNDYRLPHPKTSAPINGGKYPAQLLWDITAKGEIIFKIVDGNFGDPKEGRKKEVKLSAVDRGPIFNLIRRACTDENFEKAQHVVRKKDWVFQNGQSKMSDAPILQGTFTVFRNQDGTISLGFSKSDFKAKLELVGANDNECLYFKNGEYIKDVGMGSRLYAMSYVDWVEPELNALESKNHQPPQSKNQSNNSGSTGGGSGGGNSFDDEIDMDF